MKNFYFTFILLIFLIPTYGQISFTEITSTSFVSLIKGESVFADFDNDNDLDLLISGEGASSGPFGGPPVTNLYINDGSGSFSLSSSLSIDSVHSSAIAIGDIDNDNDLDVFIAGNDGSIYISKIYTNDGSGNFTNSSNTIVGFIQGDAEFGDIDGDNDLDLVISGYTNSGYITYVYTNNGSGSFNQMTGTSLAGTNYASVKLLDIDNDNDLDLFIAGQTSGSPFTNLYTNNGSGVFSLVNSTPFDGCSSGDIEVADVEGDNDIDILISGYNGSSDFTKLYINDGSGNYSLDTNSVFKGLSNSSINFGDIDLDNDYDILISGYSGSDYSRNTILYKNNGSGVFNVVDSMPFSPSQYFGNSIGDIDGDNDLDIYLSGTSNGSGPDVSSMYLNNNCNGTITTIDTRTECSPFTWIDGNTYTSDNDTAIFTLISSSGCDSVITLDLTIDSVSDISTSLAGTTITANNDSATYRWLDCDNNYAVLPNETGQTFTATVNGNYAVELTENNCVDTSACVSVTSVGIEQKQLSDEISIYPNPSSDVLNIEFISIKEDLNIEIYSVEGKLIKTENFNNTSKVRLNLNIRKGIYYLKINEKSDIHRIIKFIKQ